jgi:hypothetical protein
VATLTLPTFGIDVYTNGDFEVDIGFPWLENFARSFGIEAIVPPGIPVTGAGGFYFGKLSSASTDRVPAATDGWFNPVLVFGFGAQIGLGKSIEAGILRAGFSLTVFGIIEGVLARWLPYDGSAPNSRKQDLQDGYYFSLTGSVGAIGKLYGTVDFAIIKADVNLELKIKLQIVLASFQPIPISVAVSVVVSVSVKINLGLFKITIDLSFSMMLKMTFVLENPWGNPPWHVEHTAARQRLTMVRRLRDLRVQEATFNPTWTNLKPATEPMPLAGYVSPVLTVAGDEASAPSDQEICYVACYFLRTPPPVTVATADVATAGTRGAVSRDQVAHAALARSRGGRNAGEASVADDPASFEDFAVRVLQ